MPNMTSDGNLRTGPGLIIAGISGQNTVTRAICHLFIFLFYFTQYLSWCFILKAYMLILLPFTDTETETLEA